MYFYKNSVFILRKVLKSTFAFILMKPYRLIITVLCVTLSFITNAQIITTFGGNGLSTPNSGDNGPATAAVINYIGGECFDKHGNYYVTTANVGNTVRRIDNTGIITTIAGTGIAGYSGDNGPATAAKLKNPQGVVCDTAGNIFIAEYNNVIRRVDHVTGIITTFAGTGTAGYGGDGGPATAALLNGPNGMCFDKLGNLFIADYGNFRIRKINPSGIITTVAGTSIAGYNGDGGRADTSQIRGALDVCNDTAGNLYIADEANGRIRKVDLSGIIHTIAGTGTTGYSGDGGSALSAEVRSHTITIDKYENIYFTDIYTYRVRKIDLAGNINTLAGTGVAGYNGDGGRSDTSQLKSPSKVAVDSCGNLYISDGGNYRIRKVTFDTTCGKSTTDTTNHHVSVTKTAQPSLHIYPNPVIEELHIDAVNAESYNITNIAGYTLKQGAVTAGKNTIDVRNLALGIYLLTLTDVDGQRTVYKIMKE